MARFLPAGGPQQALYCARLVACLAAYNRPCCAIREAPVPAASQQQVCGRQGGCAGQCARTRPAWPRCNARRGPLEPLLSLSMAAGSSTSAQQPARGLEAAGTCTSSWQGACPPAYPQGALPALGQGGYMISGRQSALLAGCEREPAPRRLGMVLLCPGASDVRCMPPAPMPAAQQPLLQAAAAPGARAGSLFAATPAG